MIAATLGAALVAAGYADAALARGGHHGGFRAGVVVRAAPARIGVPHFAPRARVFIGAPIVAAPFFYYPRPVYYPAPVAVVPYSPPPQYIEQPAPQSSSHYWYYCSEAGAYYPYVRECPGGWQQVVPQPPSPS